MRKTLFIIMGLLLFLSSACADVLLRQGFVGLSSEALAKEDDFVLSGYTEIGRRSQSEDYEEENMTSSELSPQLFLSRRISGQ